MPLLWLGLVGILLVKIIIELLFLYPIAKFYNKQNSDIIFGDGFGGISDLEVGPYDGYLYVVSLGHGAIYRIVPK